jgi:hypothetical protein
VLLPWRQSSEEHAFHPNAAHCDRQHPTYCVEKVERQRFQKVSDVQLFHDRSTVAVLVSLGRQDFCPEANVAEFFNTIDPKRTLTGNVSTTLIIALLQP